MVKYIHSFESHDDLVSTLQYVFPHNDVARDMSLAATKSSYSVAFGLGPFFHQELIEDVKRSYFTLTVYETTTQQDKKQLNMHVRYWSLKENQVVT